LKIISLPPPEFGCGKVFTFRCRGIPGRLDALLAKNLTLSHVGTPLECKIYPFPWNFHFKFNRPINPHGIPFILKFGLLQGISMCKLPLPMEFPSWDVYSWNFSLTYVLPWNFHPIIFTPLEIP
jgi:hypothetical protein